MAYSRALLLLTAILLGVGSTACPKVSPSFDWRDPTAMRTAGPRSQDLTILTPEDAVAGAFADRHYVGLVIERLFLRALPGLRPGDEVVVGLRLGGALANGKELKSVSEPVTVDADGAIDLKLPWRIESFRFRGELQLELAVQKIASAEVQNIGGRVQGAGGMLRALRPWQEAAINTAASLYASIVGAFRKETTRWSTTLRLVAEAGRGPHPQLLAGRTLLFFSYPGTAPAELRARVNFKVLTTKLALRGDQLEWRDVSEAYRETPYLVLGVQRTNRHGTRELFGYRQLDLVDAQMREVLAGSADALKAVNEQLAAVESKPDPEDVLTAAEKALLLQLCQVRKLRLEAALAEKKGDRPEQRKHSEALVNLLDTVMRGHERLLTSAERMGFADELRRLRRLLNPE